MLPEADPRTGRGGALRPAPAGAARTLRGAILNARLQIWWLEVRRRLARLRGGEQQLWQTPPAGVELSPSAWDFACYERAPLRLSWARCRHGTPPAEWQRQARARLRKCLGMATESAGVAELIERRPLDGLQSGLSGEACYLRLGNGRVVPVSLVRETAAGQARPLMICLQGHTTGAHISWGRPRLPIDVLRIARGGDFARQAVREGHVAVCIEQVCFGERRETAVAERWEHPCIDAAGRALLCGRTLLGDRVDDVLQVIDWLQQAAGTDPGIDPTRIRIMGNSAGGETALFATALDGRIGALIAGSCVGPWRGTSGRRRGCPDRVIPGILNWLEYEDVLALCAPRPVLVVNGELDHLYPWVEARQCLEAARAVWAELGAAHRLRGEAAPGGHRFYPDIAWPAFRELMN